jgi:DNA polymerase III epsilon subunit-like protein
MSGTTSAVTDPVAIASLWGGVRVVVIDTETTGSPSAGPLRAVSIAAVTCRAGTVRGKWQTLVNPGVAVDRKSRSIHGITDEHLEGEPTFAEVAGLLLPLLTPRDGEQLVLAAHNVGFDVAVLRNELDLLDQQLPEIPTLDTMGKLRGLAGVRPASGSLSDLVAELGIVNTRQHDAMADAVACAEALVELLNRAASVGYTDFDALLAEVSPGKTTHTVRASKRSPGTSEPSAIVLPDDHIEGHASLLSPRAGVRMLATWRNLIIECASLRCRHLADRVEQAGPDPGKLRNDVEGALTDRIAASDTAGAATVLGALLPLLAHIPARPGRLGLRAATLAWAKSWSSDLASVRRCRDSDLCPACRLRDPCPLDVWPTELARLALGDPARYASGFFETKGREAGTGVYTSWEKQGVDARIGDAAVWLCVEHWRSAGQDVRADQLTQLAWNAGCRDPDVADAYAGQLAAPGRLADLDAATELCDIALSTRAGSTHEGWARLLARRSQIAGRRQRLTVRPSGTFDEDGRPVPIRRHQATSPRRTRPLRFLRNNPPKPYSDEQ